MKKTAAIFILLIISQVAISQNTILWKVTDTINNKTSHIVGTFHQFGSSFVDSFPEIKSSLLNSDIAVFESTDKAEDNRKIIAQRPLSNEIEKHIKRKSLKQLKEITKDWKVDLYKLKPIEISWKLRQDYQRTVCKTSIPTDTFNSFDVYIAHLAEKNNIPIKGLETNQLNVIKKGSGNPNWKKERKLIKTWVQKIRTDKYDNQDCDFATRYRNMNLNYEFEKECEKNYFIFERNNLWMEAIPELLRNNNAFITVGYSHLKWNCGLLQQLKRKGFKIEPVEIKSISNSINRKP